MSEELPRSDATPPQDRDLAAPATSNAAALIGNVVAGCRLALFMRARAEDFRADLNQAVYALAVLISLSAMLQFADALPYPEFNRYGIANLATVNSAGLLALWLVAAIQGAPARLSLLVVMVSTAFLTSGGALYAGGLGLEYAFEGMTLWIARWVLFWVGVFWQIAIAMRTIRLALGVGPSRSFVLTPLYAIVALAPVFGLPQQSVWYEGQDPEQRAEGQSDYRPVNVEHTFYAQPALLDAAIGKVVAERPGVTDLYFLGFAGHGEQDVFMKEVRSATSLFEQRFDTAGRSLQLINNRSTVEDIPLASISNLRMALKAVAARMNTDEDILFLFLTSHGSPDELSTRFWPLQLNNVTADGLRSALDDSGIRWRVIVVSACYSGSFIDELRNEETLIITASRKDRNSFGCSNEADFTYFGRAFLDEALRETQFFIDAFGRASQAVAEREEKEGRTPSQPQIHIGSRIQGKLIELERRLRELGDVATSD